MTSDHHRTAAAPLELTEDQLDTVVGGAWYAKFDGVDGSSKQKDRAILNSVLALEGARRPPR